MGKKRAHSQSGRLLDDLKIGRRWHLPKALSLPGRPSSSGSGNADALAAAVAAARAPTGPRSADADDVISLDSFSFEEGEDGGGQEFGKTATADDMASSAEQAPAHADDQPAAQNQCEPAPQPLTDAEAAAAVAEVPAAPPQPLLLTRQRGAVIVSSSGGSDRSCGSVEGVERYDLASALQAASVQDIDQESPPDRRGLQELQGPGDRQSPSGLRNEAYGQWFPASAQAMLSAMRSQAALRDAPPALDRQSPSAEVAPPSSGSGDESSQDVHRPAVHTGIAVPEPALWRSRVGRWLRDGERQSQNKATASSL